MGNGENTQKREGIEKENNDDTFIPIHKRRSKTINLIKIKCFCVGKFEKQIKKKVVNNQ